MKFIYLNLFEFELYNATMDDLLFSGIYDTEAEYINLYIDYNDFFIFDVDTIRLSISLFDA